LFKATAGALGWEPEIIMHTPIPQLILAIEGKYEFAMKTNPFGGAKKAAKKIDPETKARVAAQALKLDMLGIAERQKSIGMKPNV